jgi:hypothetical protein
VKHAAALILLVSVGWMVRAEAENDGDTFVRLQWARSSEPDFTTAVFGDYKISPEHNYLIGGSYGRRIADRWLFDSPIMSTWNIGMQYFNERGLQDDGYGVTAYYKIHYLWRLPWTQMRLRLGLAEGLSYASIIPESEQRDFAKKHGAESSHLMNHLEWTVDVPLSQFDSMKSLFTGPIRELNVGFVVWHRSSVYGLFADTRGGVNYMGFGVEARY